MCSSQIPSISGLRLRGSFIHVAGDYRSKVFEMDAENSQMVSWNGLDLKFCSERRPNSWRIVRVVSYHLRADELNCAVVKMWTIASQRAVGMFARALHGRRMSRASRYLAGRAPIIISRNVQPARRGTNDVGKSIAYRQFADSRCALIGQTRAEANALL